jgi:hypothetical protein
MECIWVSSAFVYYCSFCQCEISMAKSVWKSCGLNRKSNDSLGCLDRDDLRIGEGSSWKCKHFGRKAPLGSDHLLRRRCSYPLEFPSSRRSFHCCRCVPRTVTRLRSQSKMKLSYSMLLSRSMRRLRRASFRLLLRQHLRSQGPSREWRRSFRWHSEPQDRSLIRRSVCATRRRRGRRG